MPSVNTSGSQAIQDSDNEVTLATISTAGTYQLALDLADMANDETVIARIKGKVRDEAGDTARVFYEASWSHAQSVPNKASIPIIIPHTQDWTFTLETSNSDGDITIPWAIYDLS